LVFGGVAVYVLAPKIIGCWIGLILLNFQFKGVILFKNPG
jgi:hypothetical protein